VFGSFSHLLLGSIAKATGKDQVLYEDESVVQHPVETSFLQATAEVIG